MLISNVIPQLVQNKHTHTVREICIWCYAFITTEEKAHHITHSLSWITTFIKYISKGSSIIVNIITSVQNIHLIRPRTPPTRKCTHQHFLNAKTVHENDKSQAKILKVYGENIDFTDPPTPLKVYGLYTHENVNCMFCILMKVYIYLDPSPPQCMFCTLSLMLTFMDDP